MIINNRQRVLIILLLLVAIATVVISSNRLITASSNNHAATNTLQQVRRDAATILSLRDQVETVSIKARPTEDVIALINSALAGSGLSSNHLADVRNESDAALNMRSTAGERRSAAGNLGGLEGYRRQSVSINLRNMSIGDLGSFLIAWREVQSIWTITRLTLNHSRSRSHTSSNIYEINLIISAIYLSTNDPLK